MADTQYTYSIQNNITIKKVSTDRLSREIQLSSITSALDYINTIGDDLDIYFKSTLSDGDKTTLDSVVLNHSGIATNPSNGLVLYKVSPNIVGGSWSNPWTISPPAGYLYKVVRTILVTDTTTDLNSKKAAFIVNHAGDDGSISVERDYLTITDYVTRCQSYESIKGYDVYTWNYTPNPQIETSIPLRNSQGANIQLSFPDGVWTAGVYASLTIVVISTQE